MSPVVDWKLADPQAALQLISNDPIGSRNIDSKPIELPLESNLSFAGDDAANLSINSRGRFSVAILNDAGDPDEDGILRASGSQTPAGVLLPQLGFDPAVAYLKIRAEAGVKAAANVPLMSILSVDAEAAATAVFADYRVARPAQQAREAFVFELSKPARFATKLQSVLDLEPGAALAFQFGGTINADVTISWADVFAGQLGSLARLLGTVSPIAVSARVGASLSLTVGVSDDFLIVFSRVDANRWRIGVRKAKSTRVAPSLDAGIDVGFSNPGQLQELVSTLVDGALGAPLATVKEALKAASLHSLNADQRKIALSLIERFGLDPQRATIQTLRDGVNAVEKKVADVVEKVVKTRVALSFTYEYNRVALETNLLQATVDTSALSAFHARLIRGDVQSVAAAVRQRTPGIGLELYLNQKEITRTRSYGFTLGFGKWASIGGKDFKKVSTIRRKDVAGRIQDSYLGARSYSGSWIGEEIEWGVDLKADMKDYAAEPLVSDFSFGLHLLWTVEQKNLSGTELEEWLDSAIVWRVCRESDVLEVRAMLAPALARHATVNLQLTCPNSVLRAVLPALSTSPVRSFAPALAIAMPWMKVSEARRSVGERGRLYAPLWSLYLDGPERTQAEFAAAAEQHVEKEGRPELRLTERTPFGASPFSFAGLTQINGDTRGACQAFTRGCNVLQTAILSGARNQKTIDKAFSEMDDLWGQSHHVRAVGAYLLNAAEQAGMLAGVTRTMTVDADEVDSVVITA